MKTDKISYDKPETVSYKLKEKHELPPLKKRKDKYSRMMVRIDKFIKDYF